ncbi:MULTISPECIES: DUF2147 domain-containing protein [Bradyrhizobium]|uniref:Uncharacterized conserved protein, DUF2147 family n=2 Tax=Bradyrhizobium TaxID=374 RepID=A0ABY0QFZ2_9BRAD|nr:MULTISPECIES: DUF2147 domain-containing protein [Bradyrhizobium]SDK24660.1 Uncharacterized conserved protein, DUF2147 family [Bradyrhizobium ottawaense]SEE44839.1 Uncharacterized conserved protein, DUF2147 family [Bradyrhizobium lablabi]SHM44295.1 Uncharacterized conserved protein, DUF2147 family [Bradyrhizobium lablabi]
MKKLLAIAALLLASTAAQAQYTFEYGGRTIRVDPDRGTVSIPGVYDNSGRKARRSRNEDTDRSRNKTPQQAKTNPQQSTPDAAAPAPSDQAATPAATAPVSTPPATPTAPAAATTAEPSTSTAAATPADTATTPPPAPPAPPVQQEAAPVAKPAAAPAPVVAAAPPTAPAPATVQAANSPLGLWLTEEKEGKVRIEQCGANLCGYSVDKKSNQNGEQVLINMKPAKDAKWSGRILDPNTGSTYDSTIALKGSDSLRVQGCAFGGVFCGGQTWTRVN